MSYRAFLQDLAFFVSAVLLLNSFFAFFRLLHMTSVSSSSSVSSSASTSPFQVTLSSTSSSTSDVDQWLEVNNLKQFRLLFAQSKITELWQCALEEMLPDLGDPIQTQLMTAASQKLRHQLILAGWLNRNGWSHLIAPLEKIGIHSLESLAEFTEDDEPIAALKDKYPDFVAAREFLPSISALPQLEKFVWDEFMTAITGIDYVNNDLPEDDTDDNEHESHWSLRIFGIVIGTLISGVVWILGVTPADVFHGLPIHKSFTKIDYPSDAVASNTKTIKVRFFTLQRRQLEVTTESGLEVEVWHQDQRGRQSGSVTSSLHFGEEHAEIVFTARRAGVYKILLKTSLGHPVRSFPLSFSVLPGPACARSTALVGMRSATQVLTSGCPHTISIEPRDAFGNPIGKEGLADMAARFSVKLKKVGQQNTGSIAGPKFLIYHAPVTQTLSATIAFNSGQEGWYNAAFHFGSDVISNPNVTLLVLTPAKRAQADHFVALSKDNLASNYFEASLVAVGGAPLPKPKTVFCYLTPKQLTVKEYYFKIIPRRLYTFRLCPSTKLALKEIANEDNQKRVSLVLEDGFQNQPELIPKGGDLFPACFHMMMLRKLGGSESFADKQTFFYASLIRHHSQKGHRHSRLCMTIDRSAIVDSSYRATRWFGESDWAKLFEIEFIGEPGIDQGGVRREWFEILSRRLFQPEFGLFQSLEEGSSALMPNPNSQLKTKMFKFVGKIVGKCLYESAHGATYRQFLPVRLAKSFLAQIVGLRVHFRHFADDAPELYTSKIRFIENNNVQDLELTFTDDEYSQDGRLLRTVELKPGGSKIRVTDENKLEYLDLLAQYKLCSRLKDPIEMFLEGLHQFVPESLLSMFDESELELLICGVRDYSVEELKKHHNLVRGGLSSRALDWFWIAVDSFSSEQMARLIQFTTGSSQLPIDGFGGLRPKFQIASSQTWGNLPTAHTCFNMICLPEHESFHDFEQALITAITEGAEGFGLA